MPARLLAFLLLAGVPLAAAQKNVASAKGENQDLAVTVTLYIDSAGLKQLIGNDLDGNYIVADVKVEPKYGKEVAIYRDDFQLSTDKDGEKTKPYAPSQIAGRGALVISRGQSQASRTTVGVGPTDPYPGTVGGYPGSYPPGSYPGGGYPAPGVSGGMGGDADNTEVTVKNAARDKENPLEKTLKDRELPEKKTDQPISGLLYFPMEKQKMKDLEVTFGGRDNRITLKFK
jgi:hypothetical protein